MKKFSSALIFLTCLSGWAGAQDAATALQVAPSDQIRYPDASQVLNKTETPAPKPVAPTDKSATTPAVPAETPAPVPVPAAAPAKPLGLPSAKPLLAAKPIPAAAPKTPREATPGGWGLRWTVSGDEAAVKTWAQGFKFPVTVTGSGPNLWVVETGPLDQETLAEVWKDQAGRVSLVKR